MTPSLRQAASDKIIDKEKSEKIRIFLIGSSRMMGLDAEYLDYLISLKGKQIDVYNQGLSSDLPSRRLTVIDSSLANDPDIVFIGVDLSNFLENKNRKNSISIITEIPNRDNKRLPNIQDLYSKISLDGEFFEVLSVFDNPKFTTLKFIQVSIQKLLYGTTIEKKQTNTLFDNEQNLDQNPNDFEVSKLYLTQKQSWDFQNPKFRTVASEELIHQLIIKGGGTEFYSDAVIEKNSAQENSLRRIIELFQQNNIKVVLFTTPVHKAYLDSFHSELTREFVDLLEQISNEYGISVYYLHDRYSGLEIWRDNQHVIWGDTLYTDDIAEIIWKEIEFAF